MPPPRSTGTSRTRVESLERFSRIAGVFVAVVGAAVIAGYVGRVELLVHVIPSAATMKVNTAICFVLTGLALATTTRSDVRRGTRSVLSWLAIAIAAASLSQYVFGIDLGIDEALFRDVEGGPMPGRMAPTSSIGLILANTAILNLARRTRVAHVASSLVFFIGLTAILGYLFGVSELYTLSTFASLALHTSVNFVVLALGILASHPTSGLTATFANHGAGGLMARRVLPLALAIPVLAGWLIVTGERADLYEGRFASALIVVATVVVLAVLIWWTAQQLYHLDERRFSAEEELRRLNLELEQRVADRTAELASSEERFRSVTESATYAIVTADETNTIVAANPAAEAMFGYPAGALAGRQVADLVPDDSRDAHLEGFSRYVRTGEPHLIGKGNIEVSALRHDGSEFPIELALSAWTVGDRTYFTGIMRDITERREAERVQHLLATVVASTDDAIYTKDEHAVITAWNKGAELLYGYTADEAIGRPVAMLIPEVRAGEDLQLIERVLAGHSVDHYETERMRKDGSIVPISLSLSPLRDDTGAINGAAAIAQDITERKRAEEELKLRERFFRTMAESVSDLIVQMNAQGVTTYASPAAERILGYEPEELVDRTATEFISSAHTAELERIFGVVLNGESATTQQPFHRKDGKEVWLEAIANPVIDPSTRVTTGITWVIRDVSGHVAALEQERELTKRERDLNALKNEFVGIVAHDLKSPMTVIGGFADLLVENWSDTPEDEKIAFLRRIRENVGRLSALVDDVLQVARIESGEMTFNLEPIDLGSMIRTTSDEVLLAWPGHDLELKIPDDLPTAMADEDRQWRILTNLLSNAFKFSDPPDPVMVEARVAGEYIAVSVTDRGHGIKDEDLSKLFQPFARVEQAEGRRVKGTGLGLYICRSLVEGQGGTMSVASVWGQGSTFTYTVPIARSTP